MPSIDWNHDREHCSLTAPTGVDPLLCPDCTGGFISEARDLTGVLPKDVVEDAEGALLK